LLEVGGTKEAYLHFDLGSVSSPIERAVLLLSPQTGDALAEHELSVVSAQAWTETGVTWQSRPAADKTLARWVTRPGLPVEVDITAELQRAFRSDRKLSFRLASVDGGTLRYAAREHATEDLRPQILLVTGPNNVTAWRARYFLEGSSDAGNFADPDGDGVPNLLEYAFALRPHEQDDGTLWETRRGTDGRMTATFYRARADVIYTVEASDDLQQWTAIAVNPGSVGATVTVTDTAAGWTKRFLRLRVEVP